jgi:hypothetical protein
VNATSSGAHNHKPAGRMRIPGSLIGLAVVLFLESAALAAVTIWFLVEILTTQVNSVGGSILTLTLAVGATAWIASAAVGALRAQSWVRGAALTWQLCQVAVAVGAFQGIFAQPAVGVAILVPTVAAVVLLFVPPTTEALRRDPK